MSDKKTQGKKGCYNPFHFFNIKHKLNYLSTPHQPHPPPPPPHTLPQPPHP